MEKTDLEYITNQIFRYIDNAAYDKSTEFKGFKLEMMINLQLFLSPENYEKNKIILNKARIQESTESENKYLEKMTNELLELLDGLYRESVSFNLNKVDVIIAITKFLNPSTYKSNIKALKQEDEHQKRLTIPSGRW